MDLGGIGFETYHHASRVTTKIPHGIGDNSLGSSRQSVVPTLRILKRFTFDSPVTNITPLQLSIRGVQPSMIRKYASSK
jgi:hypothetical protein